MKEVQKDIDIKKKLIFKLAFFLRKYKIEILIIILLGLNFLPQIIVALLQPNGNKNC